ncbi:MAG: pyridoxal 5'-phosphate synthase glutaminase subunit PdxT [Candidatus Melainabacteria bacterium]|nr:pyridoxal 5'-phosphate synthase glutaminase subunit PdxT [Candidatus Melainabacteria bacterium]
MTNPIVGVLAIQGDFAEHRHAIEQAGARSVEIRHLSDLDGIDALIIPGGESTTINKFDDAFGGKVFDTINAYARGGMPIYGTCMGSIVLAKQIESTTQRSMGLMNITVRRNAYGPQKKSFETMLAIKELGAEPYPAVFIRAPQIVSAGSDVTVMATINDTIAMARQGNLLVTTFHPEITDDLRVHEYFLAMIRDASQSCTAATPNLSMVR